MNHYPYRKVMNFRPEGDDVFILKSLYTFRSPKSKQCYWVWVEEYEHNMYAVKFHLKADKYSKQKYNRLTGYNEARTVINSCMAIMLEIYRSNNKASFGFVGSNLPGESESETKRFRVYKRIMATYFSINHFQHIEVKEKSAYMLICQKELKNNPDLIRLISEFFSDNYAYFD
jgi:hypothetical protein